MSGEDKPLVEIVKKIHGELERRRINTDNMIDKKTWEELHKEVKDIVNKSELIDTAWREVIKAKAIVNPSEYIADRAEMLKKINTDIVKEANDLYKKLTVPEYGPDGKQTNQTLPENAAKALVARKLVSSVGDYYAEVNTRYPINNLATSLQNAITSSNYNPKVSEAPKPKRGRRKK